MNDLTDKRHQHINHIWHGKVCICKEKPARRNRMQRLKQLNFEYSENIFYVSVTRVKGSKLECMQHDLSTLWSAHIHFFVPYDYWLVHTIHLLVLLFIIIIVIIAAHHTYTHTHTHEEEKKMCSIFFCSFSSPLVS